MAANLLPALELPGHGAGVEAQSKSVKELWGTECIVIKDEEPQEDCSGEIIAIPVSDFVSLFQEPIDKKGDVSRPTY